MRTAPIGPSKGMPEIMRAADEALIASTSCGFNWSAPRIVPDDVDLVAEALGERRPQRSVDEAAGQDRLVGRPALAAEERPRDLAGGVHPLFDVDGEGEEVGALTHFSSSRCGCEHDSVADPGDDGTVRLTGELAGLEGQGPVGPTDGARHGDGISHDTPM